MKSTFLHSIKNSIKHWYVPVLVGLLFIIISIVVFTSPLSSLITLSMLFSLSFIFGGLSEIIFSIANRKGLDNWGWTLAFGILTLVIGMSMFTQPALSISILSFYVGFLLLFRSISSISFALDVKRYGSKNWTVLLIFGILGAIASFFLIWNPLFAGFSVVILIAMSFLFTGLFGIFFGLQLKKIHNSSKQISTELKDRYENIMREIDSEWNK